MERDTEKKVTVKQLHDSLKNKWKVQKALIMQVLEAESDQTFYDILNGRKKLKAYEKNAIAEIYGHPVELIDWKDKEKNVA